ncbi:MAG: 3'-5' exonuclease [Bacteroidales bacterium]|jgi:predicted PolB exonuclease-like 3'-5' exonuclease|nr:3'-5' exonuclease [Bacteroidales bacterium]
MLSEIDVSSILFLDIETVPQYSALEYAPQKMQMLWDKKSIYFRSEGEKAADVYSRAGIYAEFGKIICISVGKIFSKKGSLTIKIKSFSGDNEKTILSDFADMLEIYSSEKTIFLCAHNGKEFDYPFLARRMLIQGVKLPDLLDNAGKKPWEVKHLDTMDLWKFGDYKHYTSLDLLTAIFNISSPKDDIDGSQVAKVYWQDRDLKRIIMYCQNDVLAVAQIILRYKGLDFLREDQVEIVEI